MKKSWVGLIVVVIMMMLIGCVTQKTRQEPRVYCIPWSQWQEISTTNQHQSVEWFNQNGTVVPKNLKYSIALGDAQFSPPGTPPVTGIPYYKCFRNMNYAATINNDPMY